MSGAILPSMLRTITIIPEMLNPRSKLRTYKESYDIPVNVSDRVTGVNIEIIDTHDDEGCGGKSSNIFWGNGKEFAFAEYEIYPTHVKVTAELKVFQNRRGNLKGRILTIIHTCKDMKMLIPERRNSV